MGYRSETCLGLTDDAMRLFRTLLEHLPEDHEIHALLRDATTYYHTGDWGNKHKTTHVDCGDKFYWEYVKWYESFEDVQFIESFMVDCILPDDYRFVRIGEEEDDIDQHGEYYDAEIYVRRSISW